MLYEEILKAKEESSNMREEMGKINGTPGFARRDESNLGATGNIVEEKKKSPRQTRNNQPTTRMEERNEERTVPESSFTRRKEEVGNKGTIAARSTIKEQMKNRPVKVMTDSRMYYGM